MPSSSQLLENMCADPQRLQEKLLAGKIGLWLIAISPEKQTLAISPDLLEQYGYRAAEFPSTWENYQKEIVHPDDAPAVGQKILDACSNNTPLQQEYRIWSKKEGTWRWIFVFGSPDFSDPAQSTFRISGGVQDITDRVLAQQLLRKEQQRLEHSLESSTSLLGTVQHHVEKIAQGDHAKTNYEVELIKLTAAIEADESLVSLSAQRLGAAFSTITGKMRWYKAILDSLPFPVSVSDMEGSWTYLNPSALETLGEKEPQAILGQPSIRWSATTVGEKSVTQKTTPAGEFNFYHETLDRFYQGLYTLLHDMEGNPIGDIETMRDVTDAHMADERNRIMLNTMPLCCTFWDENVTPVDCNDAVLKLFGLEDKSIYLTRFASLSPEIQPNGDYSAEAAVIRVRRAFAEGSDQFEWMHQTLDGRPLPTEVLLVRVTTRDRNMVVGYTRDMREIRAKEAALDQERQLLRKVMDSSPVCFVILVDGAVRFATPHALQFFGIELGAYVADFYIDDSQRVAFFTELLHTGAVNWRVVSMRAADGNVKEMLANAFLAEYYGEDCVMSWFLDVTEMREKERELRLARDAAEESTRAKSEFLANMSHEIRTPMNAILGMTSLVLDTSLTPIQREYLQKAELSARALLRILNDILDFSKIEAGKLEMEHVPFSPKDVAQNVIDVYHNSAMAKGLHLRLAMGDDVPVHIKGDPLRLNQVLTNLTGNAIKFTEQGEVILAVTLETMCSPVKKDANSEADTPHDQQDEAESVVLRFSVRDSGIGISPEARSRLFSAFSQADSSTTRRYGGTGLGLAISKNLVEMMGGNIGCDSVHPHGSNFFFTARFALLKQGLDVPKSLPSEICPAPAALQDNPERLVAHLKGARILVAEDNEINQIIAREVLEKAGLRVEVANNGREAVQLALKNPYDLVFMDIQMPEMDGLSATADLRRYSRLRSLPIVAMTAHAMVGDKEKSLAMGMNDHITKPLNAFAVFSTIAKWVPALGITTGLEHTPSVRDSDQSPTIPAPPERRPIHRKEETMELPELPETIYGVDIAAGLPRVAGNKKLYKRLLLQVADDSVAMREKLTAAVMNGDLKTVREVAHSLKGSSGNLAVTLVYAASEALEAAARNDDFSQVFTSLDTLEQALDAYMTAVQPLRA